MRMALCRGPGVLAHMIPEYNPDAEAKLRLRGIHVGIDDGAKAFVATKAERLFRHEPRILRLRIDVERDARSRSPRFTAKGRVELAGPDLTASVTSARAATSITLLIDKLDRMLRKRTNNLIGRRATGDIRTHTRLVTSA